METLLELGADVNATYCNFDESTTPLALAVWCGDYDTAKFLLSKGANGKAMDAKNRNLLHMMTLYWPGRHGGLPQRWHYWIRHGDWSEHLVAMTRLANLLADSGADIGAKDNISPNSTPIVNAAAPVVWNGAAICALLKLGADVNDARAACRDSGISLQRSL
jgi:ankyrin repeat protein